MYTQNLLYHVGTGGKKGYEIELMEMRVMNFLYPIERHDMFDKEVGEALWGTFKGQVPILWK